MAITDLKAHMKATNAARPTSNGPDMGEINDRLASQEEAFRLLREECIRTQHLIEDRENKGRALIAGYKNVISDLTDLFEAQRKEYQKRDEAVRFLLSSVETRIKADLERLLASDDPNEGNQRRGGLFRRRS